MTRFRLYDGFAIDYGCYVALLLEGHPAPDREGRAGWLTSARIPREEDFTLTKLAVDPGGVFVSGGRGLRQRESCGVCQPP
jgi:hypothetical protein